MDEFKTAGTQINNTTEEVVLLIHGIRDFAEWQDLVAAVLSEIPNIKIFPLGYGRFDAFRFWFPFWTRETPVRKLLWKIREAREMYSRAKLSVVAHSFGTYAIGKILKENPDIRLHRLVLCGAILSSEYRWDQVRHKVETEVINDCGVKDIWPVLAQSTTFGYGPSGRFGFRTPGVLDRSHDFGHGGFFKEKFVSDFWLPWFRSGTFIKSKALPPSGAHWHLLTVIQIKWLVIFLCVAGILRLASAPTHTDGLAKSADPTTIADAILKGLDRDKAFTDALDKATDGSATVYKRVAFIHILNSFWDARHSPVLAQTFISMVLRDADKEIITSCADSLMRAYERAVNDEGRKSVHGALFGSVDDDDDSGSLLPAIQEVESKIINDSLRIDDLLKMKRNLLGLVIYYNRFHLRFSNFKHLFLNGLNLERGDLSGSNLTNVEGRDWRLAKANLSDGILQFAELTNSDFDGAILTGADVFAARFDGSSFVEADVTGARGIGRGLAGANIKNIKGLPDEEKSDAFANGAVEMTPENFNFWRQKGSQFPKDPQELRSWRASEFKVDKDGKPILK
jgi:hypothetical protein